MNPLAPCPALNRRCRFTHLRAYIRHNRMRVIVITAPRSVAQHRLAPFSLWNRELSGTGPAAIARLRSAELGKLGYLIEWYSCRPGLKPEAVGSWGAQMIQESWERESEKPSP